VSGITGSNWTVSGSNIYRSSGNVGIGTTSPTAKLEVTGNILATDVCNASGACLSDIASFVGGQPLVNNVHNYSACTSAGGTVVDSDASYPQCKFNGSSCPTGWTQYKNYSATSCAICYTIRYFSDGWERYLPCSAGTCSDRGWADSSFQPSCTCPYEKKSSYGGIWYNYGTGTCVAPINQIGCY
jgi:hypothetical protein